jgi:hypothetical protein
MFLKKKCAVGSDDNEWNDLKPMHSNNSHVNRNPQNFFKYCKDLMVKTKSNESRNCLCSLLLLMIRLDFWT